MHKTIIYILYCCKGNGSALKRSSSHAYYAVLRHGFISCRCHPWQVIILTKNVAEMPYVPRQRLSDDPTC